MKSTYKVTVESEEPIKSNPIINTDTTLVNVIDKSNVGRPKEYDGVYKKISARLKMENYEYARIVGGRYGGMNAFINWLIEEHKKNNKWSEALTTVGAFIV